MSEANYSRRIYLHLRYKGIKTLWMQRLASIETKFGPNPKLQETKNESEWRKEVNKYITQTGTHIWRTATAKKNSLSCYAKHKLEPGSEPYYRGDRPSALLFQARTGSLATQQRRHELFDSDPSCRLCGAPEETIAHVLQVCPSPSLTELLGLSGQMDEAQIDRIQSTKSLLLRWERLCRQTESSPTGITPNTPPPPTAHTSTPPLGHRCEDDGRAESRVEPSPILSQDLRGAHSDLPLCQ
ncbi:hypothetical protein HPB49_008973 [Dermacentor silvarum]|uniref:Uncharacterized protein n=1 Tax=Dermacentor silvarum TaxID=543639 RepID=A0ACB8DYF0_DERSI|nr:hypothetical protein HPB49_008973 [Dermacentor silvarum]